MKRLLIFVLLAVGATADDKKAPEPLTDAERLELYPAVAEMMALRARLLEIEAEYRGISEQRQKAEARYEARVEELRKAKAADGCVLQTTMEWRCPER